MSKGIGAMWDWIGSISGDRALSGLPGRVRDRVTEQQHSSEKLIGWIQLLIVLLFGFLYLISPKTFNAADVPFQPVPWALGTYLCLTVVRLVWAQFGRFPWWSLALSIFFDMALLMVVIWSFHMQYGQPASFYLKAPTLLYVFIFIALRALRFEAAYVLLAGVMAALGWVALVLYAVTIEPQDPMITRNYVDYLTSNSVLLGAEFDKIISILVVSAILFVALVRARQLLVSAVAERTAHSDLSRFFAPEVRARITGSEVQMKAGHGESRDAAVLFVDIRGFTKMAGSVSPTELVGILSDYQSRVVPAIQEHDGSIDKFLGDGIMATFGAVQPTQTYAADALRALDAVIAAIDQWNDERRAAGEHSIRVGAAVTSGRLVVGAVGDETRLEYTVIGSAVNLSAKLEKHNSVLASRALTTAETLELAKNQGYQPSRAGEDRPGDRLVGVDNPVDVVVLATERIAKA